MSGNREQLTMKFEILKNYLESTDLQQYMYVLYSVHFVPKLAKGSKEYGHRSGRRTKGLCLC